MVNLEDNPELVSRIHQTFRFSYMKGQSLLSDMICFSYMKGEHWSCLARFDAV